MYVCMEELQEIAFEKLQVMPSIGRVQKQTWEGFLAFSSLK